MPNYTHVIVTFSSLEEWDEDSAPTDENGEYASERNMVRMLNEFTVQWKSECALRGTDFHRPCRQSSEPNAEPTIENMVVARFAWAKAEQIKKLIASLPWIYPENVCLMVEEEGDGCFKHYPVK